MTLQMFFFSALFATTLPALLYADEAIGLFGTTPLSLSIEGGKLELKQERYLCSLDASVTNEHFTEWGVTEKDAKGLVHKACSNKAGLLLCKEDNISCHLEKK